MNWYYMHSNNFIPKNPNSVAVESGASTATLGGFHNAPNFVVLESEEQLSQER